MSEIIKLRVKYPNRDYEIICKKIVKVFKTDKRVFAIVLTGSTARGQAIKGSCLDIYVFVDKEKYEEFLKERKKRFKMFKKLRGNRVLLIQPDYEVFFFKSVPVEIRYRHEGYLNPMRPDFDLVIGNLMVYCKCLYERGNKYSILRKKFIPFYSDEIRRKRLKIIDFMLNTWRFPNIPEDALVRNDFSFAFEQFVDSLKLVIQYLFIKKRKYPISYTKWLEYQFDKILGLPSLYGEIRNFLVFPRLGDEECLAKLKEIKNLYRRIKNDKL